MAIDTAVKGGFPILRRIAKNASEHAVEHRVVFGFSYRSAGRLVEFLKTHRHDLRQVTGVRYSGELGHPFHVVDDDTVVLPLDHPFVKEGRFASLLVRLWGDRRKLARMSRAARKTVSSRFTVEQAAQKFEQLFIRVGEEISQPDYSRAPSLNWGERSWTGDIIPPPSIYRPGTVQVGGLR